jgi:glyoxylase-like metal-dependent hydrolase (beta-lactamase superfamily II)
MAMTRRRQMTERSTLTRCSAYSRLGPALQRLAEDLYLLSGFPPYAINVYLAGDVLIDAGSRHAAGRILRQLSGRQVSLHALTHAHADHQGSSHEVCQKLGLPLWCGELDAAAVEDGRIRERMPPQLINSLIGKVSPGPPHPVTRRLGEGDTVTGFEVLDTPGHRAPRPARAEVVLHPRPRAQSPVDAPAGRAGAGACLLWPRSPAAPSGQAALVRGPAERLTPDCHP